MARAITMKYVRAAVLAAVLAAVMAAALPALWNASAVAQGEQSSTVAYVAGVADLPLMPGLAEVKGAGLVFDKPSGRIVETYAQGFVERAAVLAFYRRSLPPLGWEETGEASYRREGESLSFDFVSDADPLVLRFSLRPE